jgi:branched-chain amino acid transport system permease protein
MTVLVLLQTLVTGVALAGLYSLFALGLSLGWGLLHTINFAHFSFELLSAYVTYDLTTTFGWDPLTAALVTAPLGALLGLALQLFVTTFKIDVFGTLIVTFGLFLMFEAGMAMRWTADLRRLPLDLNPYFTSAVRLGPVRVPMLLAIATVLAVACCLGVWWLLQRTTTGRGIRAFVQDPEMASAFGVNYRRLALVIAGIAGATAGLTGTILGMFISLTPTVVELWIAVVFAVVLLGGLANPIGVMGSAFVIGLVESLTRQFADPAMARLMALVVLAIALVFRPEGLFKRLVEEARE